MVFARSGNYEKFFATLPLMGISPKKRDSQYNKNAALLYKAAFLL
jgi:hypothetical protein